MSDCDIWNRLKEFKSQDEKYCVICRSVLKAFMEYRVYHLKHRRSESCCDFLFTLIRDLMLITGSTADGAALCRWINKSYASFEIDVMISMASIPEHVWYQNVIEIPNNPDFFFIKKTSDILDCFHDGVKLYYKKEYDATVMDANSLLGNIQLKKMIKYASNVSLNFYFISYLLASIFDKDRFSNKTQFSFNGPAVTSELDIQFDGVTILELSFDYVMCIRLPFWPQQARGWLSAERRINWPDPDVVTQAEEIGCDMVAKKPPDHESLDYQWRLSFSLAERVLMNSFTYQQGLCYFIAKIIFYRHIKIIKMGTSASGIDNEMYVPSYTLKTCMLWMLEETDPKEWHENNLVTNITILYTKLGAVLESRNVPNFFLPECNNLRCYPPHLLDKTAEKAFEIAANVEAFLPELARLNGTIETTHLVIEVLTFSIAMLEGFVTEIQTDDSFEVEPRPDKQHKDLEIAIKLIKQVFQTHKLSPNIAQRLVQLSAEIEKLN